MSTQHERIAAKIDSARKSDRGRRGQKEPLTVEVIQSKLAADIGHILQRPQLYVGDGRCAGMALDAMLFGLFGIWAYIADQNSRLRQLMVEGKVNRQSTEVETVELVVQRWQGVALKMRLEL